MNTSQKLILAALAAITLAVLVTLGWAASLLLNQTPAPSRPTAALAAIAAQPLPTDTPAPPTATPAATYTSQPTPTGTRVVVVTVPPSPTPTRANCINLVTNFGASGVITDAEVEQYLRQTIPPEHLDYCRRIEYVPQLAKSHGSDISGNIIPVYRKIYVYALEPEYLTADYLLDTLVHEIGHNVHMNIRRDNFDLDVQWTELFRQSEEMYAQNNTGFVSTYARTNKFEDFAETYRAYVRDPQLLLANNPAKYEFMRTDVFNGREYQ